MPPKPAKISMAAATAGLLAREPLFPLDQVADYAALYDYDPPGVEIDAIAASARAHQYFTNDEFLQTVKWKSKRSVGYAGRNVGADVTEVTRLAFGTADERLRINLLRALQGVEWPVASALLHFGCDATYPILDWRALWALGSGEPKEFTYDFWWEYVTCCRALAENDAVASVRELDKALWKYWDIHNEQ
jgi:hypothetical protein